MATMEFAALCLDNALLLLPEQATTTTQTPSSTGDAASEQRFITVSGLAVTCHTVYHECTYLTCVTVSPVEQVYF